MSFIYTFHPKSQEKRQKYRISPGRVIMHKKIKLDENFGNTNNFETTHKPLSLTDMTLLFEGSLPHNQESFYLKEKENKALLTIVDVQRKKNYQGRSEQRSKEKKMNQNNIRRQLRFDKFRRRHSHTEGPVEISPQITGMNINRKWSRNKTQEPQRLVQIDTYQYISKIKQAKNRNNSPQIIYNIQQSNGTSKLVQPSSKNLQFSERPEVIKYDPIRSKREIPPKDIESKLSSWSLIDSESGQ